MVPVRLARERIYGRMSGRPTKFTPKVRDEILRRLTRGETLRRMCRENDHLPHRDTVDTWQDQHPSFSDQVVRARARGSHAIIEESRDIADTPKETIKTVTKETDEGIEITTTISDDVARDALRVQQRWREAEAILPKVYGKRQQLEHSGGISIAIVDTSDDELIAEIMELCLSGRLKLPDGLQLEEREDEDDDFSDIA